MSLYRKKIYGVKALHREKQILRKQLQQIEQEDFFSFGSGNTKQKRSKQKAGAETVKDTTAGKAEGNDMADYISAFSGIVNSGSFSQGLFAALPLAIRLVPGQKVKKVLGVAAKEFLGGYVKWKAIEIGYKLTKKLIVSRRQKKQAQKKEKQR